jgi:hypothetical protein
MNLLEFVSQAISEIVQAVDDVGTKSSRSIYLESTGETRTIEFDIAVSAEEMSAAKGGAGIRVLQFMEAGGDMTSEIKNSTVSRIRFGVRVSKTTKNEAERAATNMLMSRPHPPYRNNL